MVRACAKRIVRIPYKDVWTLLSNLESICEYHPFVKTVEITSSHSKGLGATRSLQFMDGSTQAEEVVQVGQGYIIFQPIGYHALGTHLTMTYSVRKIFENWTEITLEANYRVRLGPLGLICYLLHITSTERRLQKQFRKILEGVEIHLSTKKRVSKCSMTSSFVPPKTKPVAPHSSSDLILTSVSTSLNPQTRPKKF